MKVISLQEALLIIIKDLIFFKVYIIYTLKNRSLHNLCRFNALTFHFYEILPSDPYLFMLKL